jgi:hypothetical protein
VRRYRTEIVIPASRLVTLQLPEGLPPGRATVTVTLVPTDDVEVESYDTPLDVSRDDYEWWEEFGDASGVDEPDSLAVRLVALES